MVRLVTCTHCTHCTMYQEMKTTVSGLYVKIAFADQVDILLNRNSPLRPAARFNRQGQDALYLSTDEVSARVAMRKHVKSSTAPRVLIQYMVEECQVIDLRHTHATELRQRASADWQIELKNGNDPSSWEVADSIRRLDVAGLIDQSRNAPELSHLTLFRWNGPGAPRVILIDEPKPTTF